MINIGIVALVSFIFCMIIAIYGKVRKKERKFDSVVAIGVLALFLFTFFVFYDSMTAEHDYLIFSDDYEAISETSIEIPEGSSIYIKRTTSHSFNTGDNFVLTDDTSEDDLKKFLRNYNASYSFNVRSGNDIIFNILLGKCTSEDSDLILNYYRSIRDDMHVDYTVYRYKIFGIFYYDKEVLTDVYKQ